VCKTKGGSTHSGKNPFDGNQKADGSRHSEAGAEEQAGASGGSVRQSYKGKKEDVRGILQ